MRDQHNDLPLPPEKIRPGGRKSVNKWYSDRDHVRRFAPHYSPISNEIIALSTTLSAAVTGPDELAKDRSSRLEPDTSNRERDAVLDVILLPSSGLPLLLVNGEVVSLGRGRAEVILPAGRHVVEVQDNHSHSIVVDLKSGCREFIGYRYDSDDESVLGRSPSLDEAIPPSTWHARFRYWAAIGVLVSLIGSAVTGVIGHSLAVYLLGLAGALALVVGLEVLGSWAMNRSKPALHAAWERPAPQPFPWGTVDSQAPVFLGGDHQGPKNTPGVIIDFHLDRHVATVPFHKFVPPRWDELAAQSALPPQLWIDGTPKPASWGRWWYPLTPGEHQIQVVVDGRPGPDVDTDQDDAEDVISRFETVTVPVDGCASLSVRGSVYFVRKIASEEMTHFQPRLWIEQN
ncbi:hypothetical protein [Natronoglycomyces albus]|uniref:Uncharacterized protein n=1 Tax=Natronoglycomyces albus TaxID=2811108 RepID=A0A895XN29_9ACTN|nr:hypothetical protein [Natronoglycomyces albus]QSB04933.1 hypothetical protein JQS30_14380 [Natronoglycomyces albus]